MTDRKDLYPDDELPWKREFYERGFRAGIEAAAKEADLRTIQGPASDDWDTAWTRCAQVIAIAIRALAAAKEGK